MGITPQKYIDVGRYWQFGWQLVEGCTRIADGCKNCWSLAKENRFRKETGVVCHPERLERPLDRGKPASYAIWNDLFHEDVSFEFAGEVIEVIHRTPQHTYLILTKRIERMAEFVRLNMTWPHNVWLGTSCSTQADAEKNIPIFLQILAAIHFVSFEPLLEDIDALKYLWLRQKCAGPKGCGFTGASYEFNNPRKDGAYRCPKCNKNHTYLVTDSLDLAIIGCEKLAGNKPGRFCQDERQWWSACRSIVNQCKKAGVAVFIKAGPVNGKVSSEPKDWPENLRGLREYPNVNR